MKSSFLHYSTVGVPSLFSRSPVRSNRLGLGFQETGMAAFSGSREPDPDLLLEHTSLKQKHQNCMKDGEAEEEAKVADEVEEEKKRDDNEEDLLKKQLGDPPEKPLPGDCCGSGCVRCVWDIYFEELEVYNSRKAALEAGITSR